MPNLSIYTSGAPACAASLAPRVAGYPDSLSPASMATITGPTQLQPAVAEQILRTLPQWFGVESALLQYAADARTLPTFVALSDRAVIGFVSLR